MEEHIIRKETMDALKALSDINLEISKQRAVLTELEEEETQMLIDRERIKNDGR